MSFSLLPRAFESLLDNKLLAVPGEPNRKRCSPRISTWQCAWVIEMPSSPTDSYNLHIQIYVIGQNTSCGSRNVLGMKDYHINDGNFKYEDIKSNDHVDCSN